MFEDYDVDLRHNSKPLKIIGSVEDILKSLKRTEEFEQCWLFQKNPTYAAIHIEYSTSMQTEKLRISGVFCISGSTYAVKMGDSEGYFLLRQIEDFGLTVPDEESYLDISGNVSRGTALLINPYIIEDTLDGVIKMEYVLPEEEGTIVFKKMKKGNFDTVLKTSKYFIGLE